MPDDHDQSIASMEAAGEPRSFHWIGFVAGPIAAIVVLIALPDRFLDSAGIIVEFSWAGRATLASMTWMAIWWLSEPVHVSITALLPIVLFPILGAANAEAACYPYADPLVFLYFGGFVIAMSMQRWGLGQRIALATLSIVGTSSSGMIAGFMLVTAGLSAFVSNTATTAMMLPIALSVIGLLRQGTTSRLDADRFSTCLLLSIAYSASIGGVMTIIGTPTNAFLVGFVRDKIDPIYQRDISFFDWLPIGVSFAAIFLPLCYLVLTRLLYPIGHIRIGGGDRLVANELCKLGRIGRGEWITMAVFGITVALWLGRPWLNQWTLMWGGAQWRPLAGLSDPVIAMVGAMLLFVTPVRWQTRSFTMDWDHAAKMPWGILLLFGGGLSLAAAMKANGVAEFIGSHVGALGTLSPWMIVLFVTIVIVFLTELTSNAATTASLVPVLAALAPGLGVHPYLLIFPATIAASCAFMLPVATPPNAIIFGSGEITIRQMAWTGFALNVIAIMFVTMSAFFVVRPWLGF